MKNKAIKFNLFSILAYDIIALFITFSPGLIAWSMGFLYLHAIWNSHWIFIKFLLVPFIVFFIFILIIFMLRMLLPKLIPGVYPAGFNRGFLSWHLHFALARAANLAMLTPLIQLFFWTKYLYWKAMGANIPYKVNASIDVKFTEFSLITIGANSIIASEVTISCHAWDGDKLILAPVKIGQSVFVGPRTQIGLNSEIRNNVWIGHGNFITNQIILERAHIGNFEWRHDNPNKVDKNL